MVSGTSSKDTSIQVPAKKRRVDIASNSRDELHHTETTHVTSSPRRMCKSTARSSDYLEKSQHLAACFDNVNGVQENSGNVTPEIQNVSLQEQYDADDDSLISDGLFLQDLST